MCDGERVVCNHSVFGHSIGPCVVGVKQSHSEGVVAVIKCRAGTDLRAAGVEPDEGVVGMFRIVGKGTVCRGHRETGRIPLSFRKWELVVPSIPGDHGHEAVHHHVPKIIIHSDFVVVGIGREGDLVSLRIITLPAHGIIPTAIGSGDRYLDPACGQRLSEDQACDCDSVISYILGKRVPVVDGINRGSCDGGLGFVYRERAGAVDQGVVP